MSNQVDDWYKLVGYDTNIQAELHANLLKNNGVQVSLQALSAIPGMNSGAVLWVQKQDLTKAKQILDSIETSSPSNSDLTQQLDNEDD